jgi:hypothetical protein
VDQLSLPFRIGLVAFVVVGAMWFVVLKPKPATTSQSAPGATGLANDVNKAKGAVDASNGSATATGNATGGSTTTTPVAPTTPSTGTTKSGDATKAPKAGLAAAAVAGDPSRPLLAAVDKGKVAVILFWNSRASDDRATRQALRKVNLHHGKVVTRAIAISQVGKYEAITRGAQVLESPTVLVIGAGGKARSITGYTQASEINGLVTTVGGKGY